jgi:hypothetical protein
VCIENVDAHRGEHTVAAGKLIEGLGLFDEAIYSAMPVNGQDPELTGLLHLDFNAAYGRVGAALAVLREHWPVVHLVDVVAGQHQNEPASESLDNI